MRPRHPIYIPSKGRAKLQLTSRALNRMGVEHFIVVEAQELVEYQANRYPTATLLVLDPSYRDRHVTLDDFGHERSFGAGPARNFAWDHAIASGAEYHWNVDDNIDGFFRLNRNLKTPVADGTILRCMEEFVERYDNVALAGPQYFMFAPRKVGRLPPFVANTRIYSCTLIRNDIPFRWRLRMNEDTDLSLQALKAGWCTILFNAFLQYKMTTQTMAGGYNVKQLYADKGGDHEALYHQHDESCNGNPNTPCSIVNGWCCEDHAKRSTMWKSQMLVDAHPDVARIAWRFGRWHHYVNYDEFMRDNVLHLRDGIIIPDGPDEHGMILEQYDPATDGWREIADPWSAPVADTNGRKVGRATMAFDREGGAPRGKGSKFEARQAAKEAAG